SSVIWSSSMPSCSTRTDFTCSATSSLDAAISPFWLGSRKARRSYSFRLARQTGLETPADVVLDASGGESDRVRNCPRRGVSMCDHGEPAQPEEVGAAVGVRVEPGTQPARRRPDQQA